MFQVKNLCYLLLICLSYELNFKVQAQTTVNACWNPSMGLEIICSAPDNLFCVTNFTSGVGSCSATQPTDANLLYCNSGDDCNKFVTQCFNPANRTRKNPGFISCDPTGAEDYCQVINAQILNNYSELSK